MVTIWDGIIIGGVGGAMAGLTVWLVQCIQSKISQEIDIYYVYKWLKAEDVKHPEQGDYSKSTREIASWNNLSEDRVRQICSIDKRIFLLIGKDEMWSIHGHEPKSVYEGRGVRVV